MEEDEKKSDASSNNPGSNSFTTITFRINTPVLKMLRIDAESKGASLNSVVNQILKHYAEWESYESQVGMIPFPKAVLGRLFAEMTEEQVIKLATNIGKDTAIDMAIFMKGRIDASDFISLLELRMKNSGAQIVHRIDGEEEGGGGRERGEHTIIIKHDLGRNWSLYLKTMLVSALTEVFRAQVKDVIVTDSMVSFVFKKKKEGQNPEKFLGLPA